MLAWKFKRAHIQTKTKFISIKMKNFEIMKTKRISNSRQQKEKKSKKRIGT